MIERQSNIKEAMSRKMEHSQLALLSPTDKVISADHTYNVYIAGQVVELVPSVVSQQILHQVTLPTTLPDRLSGWTRSTEWGQVEKPRIVSTVELIAGNVRRFDAGRSLKHAIRNGRTPFTDERDLVDVGLKRERELNVYIERQDKEVRGFKSSATTHFMNGGFLTDHTTALLKPAGSIVGKMMRDTYKKEAHFQFYRPDRKADRLDICQVDEQRFWGTVFSNTFPFSDQVQVISAELQSQPDRDHYVYFVSGDEYFDDPDIADMQFNVEKLILDGANHVGYFILPWKSFNAHLYNNVEKIKQSLRGQLGEDASRVDFIYAEDLNQLNYQMAFLYQ